MDNCIFCKIINNEIPSVKIYEDELVLAFLDLGPINYGHTLVIPKEHHESSSTIALKRKLDYDAFNLHLADGTAAGQVVMHAHLHVVPRGVEDGFRWNWRQQKYPENKMQEIAAEIAPRVAADLAENK